jgi:putative FmdB family regulatory protein
MPRYEFRCPNCGQVFEVVRSFAQSSDPAPCPADGSPGERVYSAPLFHSSLFATVSKPAPIHHDHDTGHQDHHH